MNLLVLCPHYAPDVAPTGEVMTSIATELAARG
ncbi:MAG: colanic acid biosynthesis glycosyl transferase WcaI, partial [Acidimicrobiaceae bacterium]